MYGDQKDQAVRIANAQLVILKSAICAIELVDIQDVKRTQAHLHTHNNASFYA